MQVSTLKDEKEKVKESQSRSVTPPLVIPIGCRVGGFTTPELGNTESVVRELDASDELREAATIRITSYHRRLANSYKKLVKPRMFQPDYLVLRKVFENTTDPTTGKFQHNWEGPYVVARPGESGSYAIDKTDATSVPRMWNGTHLKRYYQ